jgi:preprotein translocase subunit YajC
VEAIQPLILIVVFIAFFYFLAIRPQKKRQQELRQIRDSLKPGDQIVTMFGMYGTITEIEDSETILVEISEDTEIRIASSSVASIVPDTGAAAAPELPTKAD